MIIRIITCAVPCLAEKSFTRVTPRHRRYTHKVYSFSAYNKHILKICTKNCKNKNENKQQCCFEMIRASLQPQSHTLQVLSKIIKQYACIGIIFSSRFSI